MKSKKTIVTIIVCLLIAVVAVFVVPSSNSYLLEVTEYSANGRPLVTVEKSTQYAGQVHLTKKMNTVGSPQLI